MLRLLPASFLIVEGLSTSVWVAGLLPTIVIYGPGTMAVIVIRALVGALQFTGGWLLVTRRPPGPTLAIAAFLISAVFTTLETGFRLAPSNLDPAHRWIAIGVYWAYAAAMMAVLHRVRRKDDARGT